ncbi:bifunctional glycosyltransferase family 2 protein/CDP-glycerol:glycerophosphate glycerophosphotransferase [Streptomyces yaanensis]|uniref:Bifunctional glycosyltransferase family 2 protein/CDP-glycerol:glycerophosphate glycerophosphotransferase n=1 Tax=Streptomyces yaanensis TaxID=1142239 RepID=A0ABV7S6X7_9ACTN|nr:bifunctional glycosyltransferase family 2 protein/CDP-glycerol:glycerophosphate glycerophosphotransferase [Streptomyces sp. CGMCC 4.7035]WNB99820.1 bifunctional glycosyltransferase family 2 protein/CDP-glycerol:glycerophosphate glycerophosphotransferase [Streptomyces sp. CGMCC 4.7035]
MDTPEPGGTEPDISVVVIVYNDARRLTAAVRSVLDQTLRNVEAIIADDCSTDTSFEVAQSLAAAHPRRVRAIRLSENSGGCGEPRNQGMAVARGRYVMFLDSDDMLEPNACRNLLEAADRTGADLVSGLCVRVHTDSRHDKRIPWYPWLYRSTRTVESIAELPDLFVFDTLSTNKCYRRDFLVENGLAFPRGIHYEDLLFSAQAYLAAGRITLIPNTVYYWNVAHKTAAKSISNRRHEINNFTDRLEIHRRIDSVLGRRGLDELKLHKDIKFLKHDLVLYLRDLPFLDDGYRHRFAELARGYIQDFSEAAYGRLDRVHAICAYLLLREDWENLMPAVDTLINRNKISAPLVEREGRIYWCDRHLDDPKARDVMDVTGLGYHGRPLERMFLRNLLTGYSVRGDEVLLDGAVVNPLHTVSADADLTAELEFRARRRSLQTFRFPVRTVRHQGDTIAWQAAIPLARRFRPVGVVDEVWDVRLHLTADGKRTTSRITAGNVDLESAASVPVRPRLSRLVADRLEPQVSAKGHLAFRLTQHGTAALRGRAVVDRNLHCSAARTVKGAYRTLRAVRRDLASGPRKVQGYHRMVRLLPVRKGTVVFESHLGKQYSDSPRAIYEELRRRQVPVTAIWSYAGERPEGFPKDVELVRRWSWRYLRALAQAEFWIDNQGFPLKLAKRPETTYIQTWHGSALKRMGFDEPGYRVMSEQEQRSYQEALDRFDHFVVRSEHDVRTLARAYRVPEEKLLRTGYARNDALVRAARDPRAPDPAVRRLAERLGVLPDRRVLLYAPTFRARPDGRVRDFELPFDVERFADRFGDRYTLLVRSHYLNRVTLPPSVAGRVIDVTGEPDITPLLLLADALITDYSSVMFDYALLRRPLVFYAYDWEEYSQDMRGTYFDLFEEAPGPVARTEDELFAALSDLRTVGAQYEARLKEFVDKYGEYDRGDAAARIVDRFFGPAGETR